MKHFEFLVILSANIIFDGTQQTGISVDYYAHVFNNGKHGTIGKRYYNKLQLKMENDSMVISSHNYLKTHPKKVKTRIVGGEATFIEEYPYNVLYGWKCGGGLINPKWVLTAAHCRCKSHVFVGSTYREEGQGHEVKKCIPHPKFDAANSKHISDYDIQLLMLKNRVNIDNYKTATLGIGRPEDVKPNRYITITGWGYLNEEGPDPPAQLHVVQLPIVEKSVCQAVDHEFFRYTLTPRMFCAGYKYGGRDSCKGDSGAVAVDSSYHILGIVSFGIGCARAGVYGVYTDVTQFRSWIESETGLRIVN